MLEIAGLLVLQVLQNLIEVTEVIIITVEIYELHGKPIYANVVLDQQIWGKEDRIYLEILLQKIVGILLIGNLVIKVYFSFWD